MRLALVLGLMVACGPAGVHSGDDDVDPTQPCTPTEVSYCYSGATGTEGVGPCSSGTRTCDATGRWSACSGEIVPLQEQCGDGVDNNCNGSVDEDVDADGDGVTTCGGDCCDSTECT